jgi:hypothetical protein
MSDATCLKILQVTRTLGLHAEGDASTEPWISSLNCPRSPGDVMQRDRGKTTAACGPPPRVRRFTLIGTAPTPDGLEPGGRFPVLFFAMNRERDGDAQETEVVLMGLSQMHKVYPGPALIQYAALLTLRIRLSYSLL